MNINTEIKKIEDAVKELSTVASSLKDVSNAQPKTAIETMDPKEIMLDYKQVFGKSCYELSGETHDKCDNLFDFILEILYGDDILDIDCITDMELEKIYENENSKEYRELMTEEYTYGKLSEYLIHRFATGIYNGNLGNSYGEHFEDIELDKVLTLQELKRSLRAINVKIAYDDDKIEKLILDEEGYRNLWFF